LTKIKAQAAPLAYNSPRFPMTSTSTLTPTLAPLVASTPLVTPVSRPIQSAAVRHPAQTDARRWFTLAIGSLVIAGLLSLAVVVGRLPFLSRIIDDPLFFKRCLVVHVDLALVVWFYAFLAAMLALRSPVSGNRIQTAAFIGAVAGVFAMLAGALVKGAQPVLANYVPIIDHPLFAAGLAAFFVGALFYFIAQLAAPSAVIRATLPVDVSIGLQAAAVTVVIAAATWVSARAGLPDGLDVYTRAEFLAWGPGHVLQAANACAMLAVWLWLIERTTGAPVLRAAPARLIFGALVLPQAIMPLLTARGTMDSLYHTGATQLMRWAIFPAIVIVLAIGIRHLIRHGKTPAPRSRVAQTALTGFLASAGLAVFGMILGACIRGSTTLVPAHYHASLGAVTVAFMTAAYFVCESVGSNPNSPVRRERLWRSAKWQLAVFGVGQTVFVLGFAIGGAYGLGRKTYAAEQHVRNAGELTGLIVMGLGGLLAVAGGLWFLFLILREMRRGWRPASASLSSSTS